MASLLLRLVVARHVRRCMALVAIATAVAPSIAAAGDPVVYPAKGQSPQQQDNDSYHCYRWAMTQSGFDPSKGVAAPPPTSNALRGAAGGAALGAAGGAIAGNAGQGAAIGAGVGAIVGGARRRAQQNAHNAAVASGREAYNRAYGVCMSGQGYTVG